ncbi:MAG: hypothetical protein HKN12_05115 [Gemmatimonadetes bacterium]|nr:hypothetical protein [Gemmatimonadota bacterium]
MRVIRWMGCAAVVVAMFGPVTPVAAQEDGTVVLAEAQWEEEQVQRRTRIGARVFFGLMPDQVGIGLQSRFGRTLGSAQWAPSVDLGVRDGVKTTAFNGDVVWDTALPHSATTLYAGGGPALVYWNYENAESDLEIGFTGVLGMTFPMAGGNKYNAEFRYGIGDAPELRFLFGLLFGS